MTNHLLYAIGFALVPVAFVVVFFSAGWFLVLIIAAMVCVSWAALIEFEPDLGYEDTVFGGRDGR